MRSCLRGRIPLAEEQAHLINYIQKKYLICFKATISELMNHDYDVEFKVENDVSLQDNTSKNASVS